MCANHQRRDLEFSVGDHVFLHVLLTKGVLRFGKKGKLNPRYIDLFEILDKVCAVAYHFALPPKLSIIHLVLHMSILQKYLLDLSHVLALHTIQLDEDLTYEEEPIAIVIHQLKKLHSKEVASVKVISKNNSGKDAT